jgi:hypothetical protein
MSSTYSTRFRLNYQAPGDNLNAWGGVLNTGVFQLLEDAIAKRVTITASNTYTLTTANGATDEGRAAFLDVTTGTGVTITAPSVEKIYLVRNGSTGNVVITNGGLTATFVPGEVGFCVSDAANFRKALLTDFGGVQITSVADPTTPQMAATKAYVDQTAFLANSGILPGQTPAQNGQALFSNGSNAFWKQIVSTDFSDFNTAVLGVQVALAVAL